MRTPDDVRKYKDKDKEKKQQERRRNVLRGFLGPEKTTDARKTVHLEQRVPVKTTNV
jgi:hypothetical protein